MRCRCKARYIEFLASLCLLVSLFTGGCESKKEEPVQEKKVAEFKTEVSEEASYIDKETEEETSPRYQPNTPPRIISARILPDPAYANTDLQVEVEAEDPDNSVINYTYQWLKAKEGAGIEQAEELGGENTPNLSHENFRRGDTVAVKVTPSDWHSEGLTYQTKPVVIVNSPPRIVSSPPETISDEEVYTYQVKVTDLDNDKITFSLGEDAPEGMTIDSETGLLTWRMSPGTVGTYKIIIHGNDGYHGTCFQRFTLILESEQTIMPE